MEDSGRSRIRRTVPITAFLVLGFGGLTVLAFSAQGLIGFDAVRENTEELLTDKTRITLDDIERRVHAILEPVSAQGRAMARLPRSGAVLENPSANAFLVGALTGTPQVESAVLVVPDRPGREYRRAGDGFDVTERPLDAQGRDVIERARAVGHAFWDEPRVTRGHVVLAHHTVLLDDLGEIRAVLVQTVSTATLAREITRGGASRERQTPFILYGRSAVLAHPLLIAGNLTLPDTSSRPPGIDEIGDAVLAGIWNPNELRLLDRTPRAGDTFKGLSFGERIYLFAFRTVEGYGDEPWIVGTYIDGSRTRTQVRRLVLTGVSGLAILVVMTVLAVLIGRGASRPAHRLARAAQLVREGHLDAVDRLPRSRLREMDEASTSFNSMVEGLRERRVIRDLFGKFVPERVAAAILHSPRGLTPQSCEATILFVDLAGFTSLAEKIGPVAIVDILNAYFSELVTIIEAHDGIITQFQGDAILAVFNVPNPVPDHARRAVEAARAIRDAVAGKTFEGQRLRCRVGVSTGDVIAGNVGATGRMNYTVHGDAVNLAARLEQMNKDYGTGILLAERTVRLAGDAGSFRELGTVEVRGRRAPVTLYTV